MSLAGQFLTSMCASRYLACTLLSSRRASLLTTLPVRKALRCAGAGPCAPCCCCCCCFCCRVRSCSALFRLISAANRSAAPLLLLLLLLLVVVVVQLLLLLLLLLLLDQAASSAPCWQ
jgi:hypothetical protein